MKRIFFIAAFFFALQSSCHYNGRTKTIVVNDDQTQLKIQYCGVVEFNEDETGIESISPNGFVKYKKDDCKLMVQSDDNGNIHYKLYYEGTKINSNSEKGEHLIANAIKDIVEHYNQ